MSAVEKLWPNTEPTPDQVQRLTRRLDRAVNGATASTHPKSLFFIVNQLEAMAQANGRGIREQFPTETYRMRPRERMVYRAARRGR